MKKVLISGGPHAGKTTLLNTLQRVYTDAHFLPEPATEVITRELEHKQRNSNYTPKVPWLNYYDFAPLVLEETLRLEAIIPKVSKLVFQDRSLIDTIAYLRLNNISDYQDETWEYIKTANYALAFF